MGGSLNFQSKRFMTLEKKAMRIGKVDVVVCGGGPAGMMAAIASARNGAKTVLIERYGNLGGMLTAGLVLFIAPLNDAAGNLVIRGLATEFIEALRKRGGTMGDPSQQVWTPHDPEITKLTADEMVLGSGTEVLYHSFVFDVVKEDNVIKGVIIINKSGIQYLEADIVIDATGDADVASYAGVPYQKDEKEMQPMTTAIRIFGVNWPDWPNKPEGWEKVYERSCQAYGTPPGQSGRDEVFPHVHMGECWINKVRVPGDATNIQDLNAAEIKGREQAYEIFSWYKSHLPGFENSFLAQTSHQIGIRETRRVIGEYILTEDDVLNCRHFEDGIARGHYWIDLHRPDSTITIYNFLPEGEYYHIPYRCLVPNTIDRLLVAGRCISGTHKAAGSYRVTSHCMAIGHAAGVAAGLSVRNKVNPRELSVSDIQKRLIEEDALI